MRILISGAGIAGLTLAYWLRRRGHEPTLIEAAPRIRDEGYMIDFFGSGFDVAERMGLISEVSSKNFWIGRLNFINAQGKTVSHLNFKKIFQALAGRYVSFMRSDLEQILYRVVKDKTTLRFGTTIKEIHQSPAEVEVHYNAGSSEVYDLVVGADGFHSKVRQLIFGEENKFEKYLGYYVAAFALPNRFQLKNEFYNYQEPNRVVGVYPMSNGKLATLFVFASPDHGIIPPGQRAGRLRNEFSQCGWIIPELLKDLDGHTPILFDKVSQIQIPKWSEDRVVLLGDACACLTMMAGQGASMAMAEAYVLAEELGRCKGNYAQAFMAYEGFLRPIVADMQKKAAGFARIFVPKSPLEILAKHWLMKLALVPPMDRFTIKAFGAKSILQGR
jgi:2-polyprenyl-6-methoxyphenol hydroxylase-like FAD-dependent oxidoreductase